MQKLWVVLEYGEVEVTGFSEVEGAKVTRGTSAKAAIKEVAKPGRFYSAIPVPDYLERVRARAEIAVQDA